MERICKWYQICPVKKFCDEKKLETKWVNLYCKGNYQACVRYKMEEIGESHPDNMLPDGEIAGSLE